MSLKEQTVLVTGALGVIGQRLTERLRADGYTVVGADLAVRDYSDYVRADVLHYEDLHRIGRDHDIGAVIHMAGEVGRMVGETHPQRMIQVNGVGSTHVAQFCLEHDAKMVFFSTSEVYGHLLDSGEPVEESIADEKLTAFSTTNIYALSKLFAEGIIRHHVDNYGLRAATIRPFMVYGPGEVPSKWRSAMTRFVHAARHGHEITVHKGAVRSWCFVDDFISGVRLVLEADQDGYEAYNIGNDEYFTMEEVARMIWDVCAADPDLIEVVEPPNRFMSLVKKASIDKVRALGYEPETSTLEGITEVVKWQENSGF